MNRREMFGMIGMGTVIAAAGISGQLISLKWMTDENEKAKVLKEIEDASINHISLTQSYGKVKPNPRYGYVRLGYSNSESDYEPGTFKQVNVKLIAGPDGHLYLNQNGKWAKVVTES